ncbi:MAG TPA: MerR family transcriptional regulator [Candidatus Anoxymicrobiaceae bacterium]
MAAEEKKYGIGEVQDILKKEFPDITISKIRFLEKEGLLNPERTPSGYRKYSKANIKQLSYILRLQREEYLPLSVIKRKMQDLKSGKVVAGDMTVMSGQGAEPSLTGAVPVSLDLAPSKLGLSAETLKELIDYGIVNVHEGPEGKYFPPSELKVLNLAKEFFRYGVEPRHLRMFNQFVGREASFIEQIIRPQLQHKDPNTKRSAIKDLENLMALSQMFIQALLRESLSRYLPRPASLDMLEEEEEGQPPEDSVDEAEVEEQPAPEAPAMREEAQPQPEAAPRPGTTEGQMFPE